MPYGLYIPNYGAECSAGGYAELAYEAERCGWGGFFLWDHLPYSKSQKLSSIDLWIALTAAAMRTEKLRFGTTVTPVARNSRHVKLKGKLIGAEKVAAYAEAGVTR